MCHSYGPCLCMSLFFDVIPHHSPVCVGTCRYALSEGRYVWTIQAVDNAGLQAQVGWCRSHTAAHSQP
jgi:hypothetical protein